MDVLEKLLLDLYSTLENEDSKIDPISLVANIEAVALGDLEASDLEYVATLLFESSSPPSMIQFLIDSSRTKDKELVKAKCNALKFIAQFIKLTATTIQSVALKLTKTCLDLLKKEDSGETKAALLLPVKNVLRCCCRSGLGGTVLLKIDPDVLNLEGVYKTLIDELKYNKKITKGTKSEAFKVLGLLVAAYPDHTVTIANVDFVLNICETTLAQNFSNKSKESPDFASIAGTFSCLDRCLFEFEGRFANNADLWKYLLQAVVAASQPDVFRYAATNKALRLIRNHAELFQALIGANALKSYEVILEAYRLDKKSISKHVQDALYAVMAQIAAFVVTSRKDGFKDDSSHALTTLQTLSGQFMRLLEEGRSGGSQEGDILHAVQGYAAIAPAMGQIAAMTVSTKTTTKTGKGKVSVAAQEDGLIGIVGAIVTAASHYVGSMEDREQQQTQGDSNDVAGVLVLTSHVAYKKSLFLLAVTSLLNASTAQSALSPQVERFLEEYVTDAVVGYSKLYPKQQALVHRSLCQLAHGLVRMQQAALTAVPRTASPSMTIFSRFLDYLVPALLMRTVTRTVAGEDVDSASLRLSEFTGDPDDRLLFAYVPLWEELLVPADKATLALLTINWQPDYASCVSSALYDKLLSSALKVVNSLDLAYLLSGEEEQEVFVVPVNMADQDVLLNLVTFLEILLPRCLPERLKYWFSLLTSSVLQLAKQFPLISALYRLLSCLLVAAEAHIDVASTQRGEKIDVWVQEIRTALYNLKPFLLELQLQAGSSSSGFKDELLEVALHLLLSSPVTVLSLHDLIPSVQMSLTTGLHALRSVQLLTRHLISDKSQLTQYLPILLPVLDRYLTTEGTERGGVGQIYLKTTTKLKVGKGSIVNASGGADDASFATLQFAVLSFLGRLGGDNQDLLLPPQETVQDSLAWSEDACILVDLPLPVDSEANTQRQKSSRTQPAAAPIKMCLDSLLPRLVELCVSSAGDKQLLTASAECFHSLLIFMIGSAVSVAKTRDSPFTPLYEKVFPAVIRLAVSSDAVCRLLFEKLLFQIVRWFSGLNQVHEDDASALLDALLARLSDSRSEGAERDVCARAMQEFFVWAIRQSTKRETARHPASVDAMMTRMTVLAAHPASEKRMAAVAVFSKIYRNLREETALVHKYAMNVLYLLLKALRQETNSAAQQEIVTCALKYEEMVAVSILSKDDAAELISVDEERPFPRSLSDLVNWLWGNAATSDITVFRRCGMRCFSSLCPLLTTATGRAVGPHHARDAIASYIRNIPPRAGEAAGVDATRRLVALVERRDTDNCLVAAIPLVNSSLEGVRKQRRWLETLNTSIDAYNWLIKLRYVDPAVLFLDMGKTGTATGGGKKRKDIGGGADVGGAVEGSVLFDCVACFVAHCHQLLRDRGDAELTARPREYLGELKALQQTRLETLYRVMLLINSILAVKTDNADHGTGEQFAEFLRSKRVWSEGLHLLVASALLGSESGGDSEEEKRVFPSLANRNALIDDNAVSFAAKNLFSFLHLLEADGSQQFNLVLSRETAGLLDKLESFSVTRHELASFAHLFRIVRESGLDQAVFGHDYRARVHSLTRNMLLAVCDRVSNSSDPAVVELGGRAVQLAVDMGLPLVASAGDRGLAIGGASQDDEPLAGRSLTDLLASSGRGTLLLNHYSDVFVRALLSDSNECSIVSQRRNTDAFLGACLSSVDRGKDLSADNLFQLLGRVLAALLDGTTSLPRDFLSATLLPSAMRFVATLPDEIFSLLLEIDAVAEPAQRNEELRAFALKDAIAVLENPKSTADEATVRLARLPFLISGTSVSSPRPASQFQDDSKTLEKVVSALEELAANKFPLDTQALDPSSPEGRAYSKVLKAYLRALTHCGSMVLLRPLLPSFREGSKHRYFKLLKASIASVVSTLNTSPSTGNRDTQYVEATSLCGFCIDLVTDEFQDMLVKRTLFEDLCIPALLKTSSAGLLHIYCSSGAAAGGLSLARSSGAGGAAVSVVKQLFEMTQKDPSALRGAEEVASLVFVQACAYRLLETLYDRCSLNAIKEEVTKAFAGPAATGKELTQSVCRAAHKTIRTKLPDSTPYEVANLLYSCAYRCLSLTVAKTQSEEQFFENFLFKEKPGETVWSRLVDCSAQYNFDTASTSNGFATVAVGATQSDWEDDKSLLSARRQRLRSGTAGGGYLSQYMSNSLLEGSSMSQYANPLRTDRQEGERGTVDGSSLKDSRRGRIEEYESSQYDYDSRATATKGQGRAPIEAQTDVGRGGSQGSSQGDGQYDMRALQDAAYAAGAIRGFDDHIIYLEMNDLNRQPAMSAVLRVVQRMATLFEAKWRDQGADIMPRWLVEVRDKMVDFRASNPRNVRLFLLRLLINQPIASIVKPWAQQLFPAVLDCVMSDLCNGPAATYNYFVRDVVFTLCDTWSATRPDYYSRSQAVQLLNFVLRHAYDPDNVALKENMFSISTLIRLWIGTRNVVEPGVVRESLALDMAPVLNLLTVASAPTGGAHAKASSRGTEAVRKRLLGLDILKHVLQSKYVFLEKTGSATNQPTAILGAVLDCLKFPRKEVVEAACEVAGEVMESLAAYTKKGEDALVIEEAAQFQQAVEAALDAKILQKDGFDNVASCLRAVTRHHTAFLTRELFNKTSTGFAKLKPRARYEYLDMLCRSSAVFTGINVPNALRSQITGLLADLSTVVFGKGRKTLRLPMVQICTLRLLTKHAADVSLEVLDLALGRGQTDGIGLVISSKSVLQVREAGYQFLLTVFRDHPVVGIVGKEVTSSSNSKQSAVIRMRRHICQLLLGGLRDSDDQFMDGERDAAKDDNIQSKIDDADRYENPWYWSEQNVSRVGIRRQIFDFFHEQYGLGEGIYGRLQMLMTELFDPSQCDQWIHYSSYLLLSLTRNATGYSAPLFAHNLATPEKYSSINLESATGSKATIGASQYLSSMTPMFALERSQRTLSQALESGSLSASQLAVMSQSNHITSQNYAASGGGTQSVDGSQRKEGYLRGTQQFSWTQTQHGGADDTASQKVVHRAGQRSVDITSTQYLVAPQTQFQGKGNDAPGAGGAMNPPVGLPKYITTQRVPLRFSSQASSETIDPTEDVESRFPAKKKVAFAGLAALQTDRKLAQELKKRRSAKVVVYRKYRDGELPDISIAVGDILRPLQSLCLMDAAVASTVFGIVFDLLYRSAPHSEMGTVDLAGSLCSMLEVTRGGAQNSLLTATLLSKCLSCLRVEGSKLPETAAVLNGKAVLQSGSKTKNTSQFVSMVLLPADLVTECAVQSLNYHGGIQFLEEQLLIIQKLSMPRLLPTAAKEGKKGKKGRGGTGTASSLTDSEGTSQQDMFTAMSRGDTFQPGFTPLTQQISAALSAEMQQSAQGIWRQLSRLYDRLNEQDVLLGLATRLSSRHEEQTKLALDAEISGNYPEAIRIYASLNEQADDAEQQMTQGQEATAGVTQEERDMWDDRSLLCLQQLCDWGELRSCVEKVATSTTRSRDPLGSIMSALSPVDAVENRLKERLLPYYITSLLHLGGDSTQELGNFVDQVLSHSANGGEGGGSGDQHVNPQFALRQWVEANYPIELATSFASRGQWSRVKVFTDISYAEFLSSWSTLHPCAYQARKGLLTKLQRTVELRDASEFFGTGKATAKGGGVVRNYDDLLRKWSASEPAISDPVCHWVDVSLSRHIALKGSGGAGAEFGVNSALHLAKFHVRSAIAAVHQGILHAVKPQLEANNALRRSVFGKKAQLTMPEVQVVFNYNKRSIARQSLLSPEVAGMFGKTLSLLDKKAELQLQEDGSGGRMAQLECLQLMLMKADWLTSWAGHDKEAGVVTPRDDPLSFRNKSFNALELYSRAAELASEDGVNSIVAIRAQTYGKFAAHCDRLLRELEGARPDISEDFLGALEDRGISHSLGKAGKKGGNASLENSKNFASLLAVQAYTNGLISGSNYCRDRVLRVMAIVGSYPATEAIVRDALQKIPSWTFLRYAAQLMGGLDKAEGGTIAAILEHVAVRYPKAIYFPYRITGEFLGKRGRDLTAKLRLQLQDDSLDGFIEALGGLTHPELRWSDGLKAIDSMLRNLSMAATGGRFDDSSVIAFYQNLRRSTLDVDWDKVGSRIGAYNKSWAKTARAQADAIAGVDGERLKGKGVLAALKAAIPNNMKFSSGKVPLNEFSQWLADFDPLEHRIEVPGQYLTCTDRPPSPERHEYIMGVDPQLLVMASIRKPKRIKFYGSGGAEFLFLVKGGEDLRNDERIEQLFVLMNSVVENKLLADVDDTLVDGDGSVENGSGSALKQGGSASRASSIHGLRARTYTVIPMTSKVGTLEWVSNTIPLKSIVQEEMARDAPFVAQNPQALEADKKSMNLNMINAYEQRFDWVKSHDAADYHKMFMKADRTQGTATFEAITSGIPTDLLRRRLLALAVNAEAFLTLRAEFAKTLAVSSLFGYLLGLGDRHLDNLLMDAKTGAIVQIDFGICFGMGSSVLPVPEFIPFRLTPQLREVLQPLDGKGLLRHYMVKCMQFLREDEDEAGSAGDQGGDGVVYNSILSNALEIYVNDPVVDWLKSPLAKEEMITLRDDVQWEPRRRVQAAVRKLQGVSPVTLFVEDLALNNFVRKEKSLPALTAILTASVGTAGKGPDATGRLQVGEQIDQLMAIGTDPNVLVRQWTGLQTWI